MIKITLSTGHKELDDILNKNGILDQEEQEHQNKMQEIEDLIKKNKENNKTWLPGQFDTHQLPKFPVNFRPEKCLIERATQRENDAGVPEWKRTKVWFISCPCRNCNPFYM